MEADMFWWVISDWAQAPALVMARAGYDVWLGNNRGTKWSLDHLTLNNKKKEYWEFDWEDMGTQDTPTALNYITKTTGFEKVTYIGHSEGTSQIVSGSTLVPDVYRDKVNLAVLLAPPISMKNTDVALLNLMSLPVNVHIITSMIETIHLYSVLPYGYLTSGVAGAFCSLFNGKLCDLVMGMFVDNDPTVDDQDRYPVMMSYLPAGCGYKNIIHYGQGINRKTQGYWRYDYGKKENVKKYGSETPPQYDLSKIDYPVAILGGSQDLLADTKDVDWLNEQIKEHVVFYHQYYLGHISFAIAKDMSWFTVDVMALVNHYNNICQESTLGSRFEEGNAKCLEHFEAQQFL